MTETIELPPAAASVRQGRHFVSTVLDTWGCSSLVETAALLTSELLTNSVLHARTDIVLSIRQLDDAVEIVVRDASKLAPRRRRHASDATTGRGIELLERLAQSWDVDVDDDGKSIRFTLSRDADPWAAFEEVSWMDAEL